MLFLWARVADPKWRVSACLIKQNRPVEYPGCRSALPICSERCRPVSSLSTRALTSVSPVMRAGVFLRTSLAKRSLLKKWLSQHRLTNCPMRSHLSADFAQTIYELISGGQGTRVWRLFPILPFSGSFRKNLAQLGRQLRHPGVKEPIDQLVVVSMRFDVVVADAL